MPVPTLRSKKRRSVFSFNTTSLAMTSPIQVHATLLEELIHLGPAIGQDVQVHTTTSSCSTSEETCTTESIPDQDTAPSNSKHTKLAFQPQRRYYVEGRVIHKRKLSRKLFFLDVSLVRPRRSLHKDEIQPKISQSTQTPALDGLQQSAWEDLESEQGSMEGESSQQQQNHTHTHGRPYLKMEVIARYPVHSLKDLDDLWRRVQLGSVIKVYGDIELSERNMDGEECDQRYRWSALMHCLAFDVLELWQGKEGFEANPGSSEFKTLNTGSRMQRRKRKNGEMSSSNGSENKSDLAEKQQTRGDESQPHCKFWLNSGRCNKEHCLFWHETDLMKLKIERRRWVEEVGV